MTQKMLEVHEVEALCKIAGVKLEIEYGVAQRAYRASIKGRHAIYFSWDTKAKNQGMPTPEAAAQSAFDNWFNSEKGELE